MNINAYTQPQGRPRDLREIPRQQLQELPDNSSLRDILQSTAGATSGEMMAQLQAQSRQKGSKLFWGGVLATGAAALLGWQGSLAGSATAVCASLCGLAGLGLAATGAAQKLKLRSQLKALELSSAQAENRALQRVDGKLEDRRFKVGGALRSALEVSDPSTGQVTARVVEVDNLTASEDVASGHVTLTCAGRSLSFPGTLELPTREDIATVRHPLASAVGEYNETNLTLQADHKHALWLTGPAPRLGWAYSGWKSAQTGQQAGPDQVMALGRPEGVYQLQSPLDVDALNEGHLKLAESIRMVPMEATFQPAPPAPMKFAEYTEIQGQADRMLQLRGEATQRYFEAEVRYANMQAPASSLEAHRAELQELNKSWQLLTARPQADTISSPADASERRRLVSMQLDLLQVKGQALKIQEDSGRVRDGLYQAKGPREAATALLNDARLELNRVESLLNCSN